MLQHGRMITQPTTVAGGQPRTPWAAINDLPLEIFCEIILLAAPQDRVLEYYGRLRVLRLVATSWSTLIDNHPKFWTIVHALDREPVWRMALQKSKAAEIDVDVGSIFESKSQTRLIKAIVGHMPRVRSLRIIDEEFGYLLENTSAAPCLRSLSLGQGLRDNDDDPIALPFHPAKWAPNLRNVDLMCSPLTWMEPLWNNLERLFIDTGRFMPGLPMQEIFTILKASPGLRSLDITGIVPPEQSPLPAVKLEALESLRFDSTKGGSLAEALNSIIALPTARCAVHFDASDETQVESALQSICRIGLSIADGEAGRKLELVRNDNVNSLTMGGFDVRLYSKAHDKLNHLMNFTQLFEGLSPSRRAAVTTVKIDDRDSATPTDSNLVPAVLSIVHFFFPNISHLSIPRITETQETALGRPNEGWLFPHLETLSLRSHNNHPRHVMGVVKPRLEAAEAGEHVTRVKTLILKFVCWFHVDEEAIAELDALVPNVVVER
ncbi:hypothetical protein FRC04_011368 [Tulasnella sp. 424]|nr:hypothetical protein FRC04_011368 [Tulasnella sp. 424]KAG8972600.1 hypothetical protein FRC05_009710 [Tulasnella sp. 425]